MNKKYIKTGIVTAIIIAAIAIYFHCLYYLILPTDMDADYCYVLLEANDVIHGNFFLNGWIQTGVSFFLTDLPFYMIGIAVFGVTRMAYVLGVMLMIAGAFFACYLLLDKKNLKYTVLYCIIAAIPAAWAVDMQRSHIGGYVWCFLMFAIVGWAVKRKKAGWQCVTAIVVCTAMCTTSDMAALVFGSGAVFIVAVYELLFSQEDNKKFYGTLAVSVCAGAVLGIIMDKLYYLIGTADKNSFVGEKCFIDVYGILDHFLLYIKSVFVLGGGNFFGKTITAAQTLVALVYAVFVIAGLYLMVKNIVLWIRHKNDDLVSVLLSVGLATVSLLFVFTNISIDIYTSRYFGSFQYISAVLICRYLSRTGLGERFLYTSRQIKWKYCIMAVAVLAAGGSVLRYKSDIQPGVNILTEEYLGEFLQEQGLTCGYGDFYSSSVVKVATQGQVQLHQVVLTGEECVYPYYWFAQKEWYAQEAHFVVLRQQDDLGFGLTPQNVRQAFGEPTRQLTFEGYIIYVYDNKDLSQSINYEDWRYLQ